MAAGADPSLRDAEGCSCIHIAAQFGHTALVAYFIARGVNPNLQDRGGMTALMWASWKVCALDPVRLLLTLGANTSIVDYTHGNTALHWAILARNATAINTLIIKGKCSLDIPNLRGDTPLTMLQAQSGSIWISQKVAERVRDLTLTTYNQQQQHQQQFSKYNNFILRLKHDKRLKWWSMVASPFLAFYLAGLIFSANTLFIIKIFLLGCLYAIFHTIGRILFDDYLMSLLPLSVYLATKLWFYVTWIVYISQVVSTMTTILFLLFSLLLWICFLKSWKGDPGVIQPTQEQRFRVSERKFLTFYFLCRMFSLVKLSLIPVKDLFKKNKKFGNVNLKRFIVTAIECQFFGTCYYYKT